MTHCFFGAPGALCLLALSLSAAAAPIETITVTASRTPTPVVDAGSAISLISNAEIRRQDAISVADLLRSVPGLAVSREGGIGTLTQVRVRGAEANQVLVLIDGIEANDVAQGSEFDFSQVLAGSVRRIEVVRGPQSALWGADALAGVINIITDPGFGASSGFRASAESGSHNTVGNTLDWDTGNRRVRADFGLSHFHTAGTNISRTGSERDGYSNLTAHVDGHVRLSNAANLSMMVRATNAATDYDAIDLVHTGLPVDAPWVTDTRQRYEKVALDARPFDNVEEIVTLSRAATDNVNHTDASINDTTRGAKNSLHAQTNIAFGDDTLSLVAEHELEQFRQRGAVSPYGNPNKDLMSRTYSLAAELHHQGRRVDWSASARHDDNSAFANADTWRVTTLLHVTPSTGVYVSAGKGIKNPTFTERFGYYNTFEGNPDLRPEQSIGWELGVREYAPGLELSASYFQSRLENEINGFVFDPATGRFTAENMASASHRRGVEMEADWDATERASIHASYTWLDATQPGPNGPEEEVRRPRNAASVRINYAFDHANINVGADYTGPQADVFFPPYPPYQERVRLAPFTLVNAAAQYQLTPDVTVTAKIDNLLDKRYEEVYGYREPGIAAYAGVRVQL